ncbi:MAG: glycosyltransferase family 39 protein, partial [Longimicrobiales bacterium]
MSTIVESPERPEQTIAAERIDRSAALSTFDFRLSTAVLALIVIVSAFATAAAMRKTSTTFDEIVLIAGGARGYETGRFDIAPEHPPLMQYAYGLPVYLSGPRFPDESGVPAEMQRAMGYRYLYAQRFFFDDANDPERLAFLGRLPAVVCVIVLVCLVFVFVTQRYGAGSGMLAALLTGFLPDVLAHGGVAYNDLPLAAALFAAVWAMDAAARRPSPAAGAITGVMLALAFGIKFSAVALVPIGALILLFEGLDRRGDRRWLLEAGRCLVVAALVAYVVLVTIYRGDFVLAEFRYGLDFTLGHVSKGHGAPGYLLGEFSPTGWWYFFPVAFLFKTPVALHALMLVGLAGLGIALR